MALRMVPLFITLYLFVIFFNVDFIKESLLIAKILILLLMSVYLTGSAKYFSDDFYFLLKMKFFRTIFYYIFLVLLFTGEFISAVSKTLDIKKVMDKVEQKSVEIEKNAKEKLQISSTQKREFWIFPNVYIMIFITIVFLIAEI